MSTPASYAPRAPPPERTTPTREENTAGLRLEAIRARNSWRSVLNSAMAAALRALVVLCGIQQAKHNPPANKNLPATVLVGFSLTNVSSSLCDERLPKGTR